VTSIVGVLCRDGAIIGTDSATTFGGRNRTIEQRTEKLDIVGDEIILAGAGQLGLRQRFRDIVEDAWRKGLLKKSRPIDLGKYLAATTVQDFGSTRAPQGAFGAMLAFPCQDDPFICTFDPDHFQPELIEERLWYDSMGSAKPITDPFLALMRKAFWTSGPPLVHDAIFAVTWALEHAIEVNPGGVNDPIRIAVLEKQRGKLKARILSDDALLEHKQNVAAAYDALRRFRDRQSSATARDLPEVPRLDL
jgi:20S proteasome alpha/beta subunit